MKGKGKKDDAKKSRKLIGAIKRQEIQQRQQQCNQSVMDTNEHLFVDCPVIVSVRRRFEKAQWSEKSAADSLECDQRAVRSQAISDTPQGETENNERQYENQQQHESTT
jgi:hypothetical protein